MDGVPAATGMLDNTGAAGSEDTVIVGVRGPSSIRSSTERIGRAWSMPAATVVMTSRDAEGASRSWSCRIYARQTALA